MKLSDDGTQVGVFKQTHEVSFAGFLKGHHGRALETQIGLDILSDPMLILTNDSYYYDYDY